MFTFYDAFFIRYTRVSKESPVIQRNHAITFHEFKDRNETTYDGQVAQWDLQFVDVVAVVMYKQDQFNDRVLVLSEGRHLP